jgi:hypothetical protein
MEQVDLHYSQTPNSCGVKPLKLSETINFTKCCISIHQKSGPFQVRISMSTLGGRACWAVGQVAQLQQLKRITSGLSMISMYHLVI